MMRLSVYSIVDVMFRLYSYTLLARIFVSWFPVSRDNAVVRFIYDMTEPVMRPFRRVLPPVGGLDFSPWLLFFVLNWLRNVVLEMIRGMGI